MTEMMTLAVIKNNQSVLAAVTLRGQSASDLTADDLVGDGLEIRRENDGGVLLRVPAEELELKTVDLVQDALLRPRAYTVVDDAAQLQTSAANSITATATAVTVVYPALPAGQKAKVWVQLEGGPQQERFVLTGEGTDGGGSIIINQALPAKPFRALVAVSGRQTAVFEIT